MTDRRQATYPPEFMKLVAERKFRQPSTGNMVKFVSLTPEEQQKLYAIYQRNVAAREQAAKAERTRQRARPTFGKAKEKVFDHLDEAGWETRRGLKVPKAVKTIGDNQVILHFKPQAVWMEVRGRENVPARSLHDDLRDVDPAKWVESLGDVAEERVRSEAEQNAPYRRAAERSLERSIGQIAGRVAERRANHEEFLQAVRGRQFRNPATGNPVKFTSLPAQEQQRILKEWEQQAQARGPHEDREDPREDASGMGHDDARGRYAEINQEAAAMENWSFLPAEKEGRIMLMPAMTTKPGMPHKPPKGDDEEIEPPPPAEIKRQLAERMREMGRSLMVSGMRAPRQQMMEIGKTLDGLIDQLDMLADQPGRQALRRRILLGLRQRVLSGR